MQWNARMTAVAQVLLSMQRHSWEQGVAAQAFLELGDDETVVRLAREAVVRQGEDGRLALMSADEGVTDPAANGEGVLHAARLTGDALYTVAAGRMAAYLLDRAPRASDGTLYHVVNAPQVWVDCLYMAPPFLALAGQPDEAVRQIEGVRKRLWNPTRNLYHHVWDEDRQAFVREMHWGVGNGWAAAGILRVIVALPLTMTVERERLTRYLRDGIDGCLAWQRPDGLFHDFVDDPSSFVETNLAQMLAYTIYRSLQAGLLPGEYRAAADRMRLAANAQVDKSGYVTGVCGAPTFDRPGVAPEGQAFFLLMEAAAQASSVRA